MIVVKISPNKYDRSISLALALSVHLLICLISALPGNNIFFPYFFTHQGELKGVEAPLEKDGTVIKNGAYKKLDRKKQPHENGRGTQAVPYSLASSNLTQENRAKSVVTSIPFSLPPVKTLFAVDSITQRSLSQATAVAKLLPPVFSDSTIPEKPDEEMWEKMRDTKETYILGDIYKDTIPATYTRQDLRIQEEIFMDRIKEDISDGTLDMPFSSFILSAEYFLLSKSLIRKGLQPSFTLQETFDRYNRRLERVKVGMPKELDVYSLVMILQRYAQNKFYPENGSGLFLESLFHNLNDCESGTKEILSYLGDLYPKLEVGSNRGMLKTTTGEVIGHMQVYIAPGKTAENILANKNGLIVETTRVSVDSVLPWSAGDIFPMEDFIFHYYPQLISGTPLVEKLSPLYGSGQVGGGEERKIVGSSDHPLKMSYGVTPTLLTSQYYDLANIRTQRIENEFSVSRIPICDPQIDPLNVDFTNVFSNFVAIDKKMRKNMMGHYLSDLPYWNNEIMPDWKELPFIATYDDFAGTLLEESGSAGKFIKVDGDTTILPQSVESHKKLLKHLVAAAKPEKPGNKLLGRGQQKCEKRVVLTEKLLEYLFKSPLGPGVFFLPELDDNFSWTFFPDAVLNDCLAIVDGQDEEFIQQSSFRKALYNRAVVRNPVTFQEDRLAKLAITMKTLFLGQKNDLDIQAIFAHRYSAAASPGEASVEETVVELGRTGINSGLLIDAHDFLGPGWFSRRMVEYGKRDDLHLSPARANTIVQTGVRLLSAGETGEQELNYFFTGLTGSGVDETLQLATIRAQAQSAGLAPREVSGVLLNALKQRTEYDSETLVSLLGYGLLKEDAISLYRLRINNVFATLPSLLSSAEKESSENLFIELIELIRTADYFKDNRMQEIIVDNLSQSLVDDFGAASQEKLLNQESIDYGILLNKLYGLAFLLEENGGDSLRFDDLHFLAEYIRFAGKNPLGKVMISLVQSVYPREILVEGIKEMIREQLDTLQKIASLHGEQNEESDSRLQDITGDSNVIAHLLLQMDALSVSEISGQPVSSFAKNDKAKGFWYLDQLHGEIATIDFSKYFGEEGYFPSHFYKDGRVKEAFSLLAYFAPEQKNGKNVKFRKIKDIKSLKNISKVKVTASSRRATRQDMSLLTLSLNEANRPQEIRRAWEDTLGVVQKHMGMEVTEDQKKYLFAPHYPYLALNNSGFIFSPEKVEDIPNAAEWGGRNDILLSSYLHFKNLTGSLPDWLLTTAMQRSEAEQKIIGRLEQRSFLPMILECEGDHEELDQGLFKAKWKIRKPYGEDIFPGTLLLLRLGYLDINQQGEIVVVKK